MVTNDILQLMTNHCDLYQFMTIYIYDYAIYILYSHNRIYISMT